MFLQLSGIGDQKISYKDHSSIEFETLDIYLLLAKKAISKFGNSMCSGLSSRMLKDEEAIANIASAIMMADWRWDENYKNKNNTKKTKYSYRNQCAIWAMQTYLTKNYKHKKKTKKKVYSLDFNFANDESVSSVYDIICNNSCESPENILIAKEEKENLINAINSLLDSNFLSDRQKDYINLYFFEGQTFEQIGRKYDITREAVRQGLNKALQLIRNLVQ